MSTPNETLNVIEPSQPIASAQSPVEVSQPSTTININPVQTPEAIQSFDMETPAEQSKPTMEMPKFKPSKKGIGKIILLTVIIILLIAGGTGAYLWRDKTANDAEAKQATSIMTLQKSVSTLQDELNAAKGAASGNVTCISLAPGVASVDAIKLAITSDNISSLKNYMADSVNIVDATSGGVTASTSVQAVTSITNFVASATKPWNFALSSTTLTKYSTGSFGKYFPSTAIIGQSANNKVLSFNFDCTTKISSVFISSNQNF